MITNRLRLARQVRSLKQIDLARLLGVTEQSISQWELGRGEPTVDRCLQIAKILNVAPYYIWPSRFNSITK